MERAIEFVARLRLYADAIGVYVLFPIAIILFIVLLFVGKTK